MLKIAAKVVGFLAFVVLLAAPAKADLKLTYAYVEFPAEIPGGKVLQPGEYAFRMLDETSSSNKIVQISLALPGGTVGTPSAYNANKALQVDATVLLVPDYHVRPGARALTFWQAKDGKPIALRTLSFSTGTMALVFVYPHQRAAELAQTANQSVPSMASDPGADVNAMKSAAIKATNPNGQDTDVTQVFGKPGDQPPARPEGKGCNYEAGDVSCAFNPGEIRD